VGADVAQFTSLAGISFPTAATAAAGQPIPLLNGWQSAQGQYGTGDPSYEVNLGVAHLSGSMYDSQGTPPAGSPAWVFADMPQAAWPTCTMGANVYTYGGGTGTISVNQGASWAPNANFTSLVGVSYPVGTVAWQPLTLQAGNDLSSCGSLSYDINYGVVYLHGVIAMSSSSVFATLPTGARPAHTLYLDIEGSGSSTGQYSVLKIDPTGAMTAYDTPGTGSNFFSLDGLSYHTGS
jgi:hypothetical protein